MTWETWTLFLYCGKGCCLRKSNWLGISTFCWAECEFPPSSKIPHSRVTRSGKSKDCNLGATGNSAQPSQMSVCSGKGRILRRVELLRAAGDWDLHL